MAERINPKKEIESIDKIEQKANRNRQWLQCQCPHTRKGELRLLKLNNNNNNGEKGAPTYACQECRKKIDIKDVSEETLMQAISTVDIVIDIIKTYIDVTRDSDLELLEKLSKVQYKLQTDVPAAFRSCNKKNRKGKRRDYDGNSASSAWNRPSTDR